MIEHLASIKIPINYVLDFITNKAVIDTTDIPDDAKVKDVYIDHSSRSIVVIIEHESLFACDRYEVAPELADNIKVYEGNQNV